MKLLLVVVGLLLSASLVEAKTVTHTVVMDCGVKEYAACSDDVLAALGHGPGLTLKAATPTDTVHGSVTIAWCAPMPCAVTITVEVYEQDSPGQARGRRSTLARPAVMPTDAEIRAKLNVLKKP